MESQAIRAAIVSTDGDFRTAVREGIDADHPIDIEFEIVVPFKKISHGHLEELRYVDPELIFLDLEEDPVLGVKLAQFLAETNPKRRMIAAGGEGSPEFLMQAMQAGIGDYLPKPVTVESLAAAVTRARKKMVGGANGSGPRQPGKLLAFFAAKGGAGSTTVATNLAIQMQRLTGKKTVVVDLDLELGESALFLGIEPRFNFVDLAKNVHRMDAGLLASFIECHDTGVHVLSAPYHPEKAEAVTADQIRQILHFLRQHYDYVVVDTSNSFTARTLATFDLADEVYLVANVDLPSLRNIQRAQHLLERMSEKGHEVRLIVNRYQPDNDITLDDVERALDMDVYWTLPNDYEAVIYAINTGRPVLLDDKSLYSEELQALGAKIAGVPGAVPRKRGWLARSVDRMKTMLGMDQEIEDAFLLPPPAVVGGES
ncbi:MAG: AAA family ATPase [Gemmatimonadetes bacterium]|nr:AAA family ATPase [Gemmatimonadota bacterium]